jgi:sec-independent protein translocase protein TatA
MFELFQPTHLLFVLLVALVVFGPKRLAGMSRELGQTVQRLQEYKQELKDELTASPPPPTKDDPEEKQHATAVSSTEKKG